MIELFTTSDVLCLVTLVCDFLCDALWMVLIQSSRYSVQAQYTDTAVDGFLVQP